MAGLLLEFAGLVLLRPTQATVLACAIGVGWVHIQARCEETDLLQRLSAYREYMGQVPRFLPRVRARRP
jgi:protein-S-isoprenylcysteine O-methyltransferase Ste14